MPLVSRQSTTTSLVPLLRLQNPLQTPNPKLLTQCNGHTSEYLPVAPSYRPRSDLPGKFHFHDICYFGGFVTIFLEMYAILGIYILHPYWRYVTRVIYNS